MLLRECQLKEGMLERRENSSASRAILLVTLKPLSPSCKIPIQIWCEDEVTRFRTGLVEAALQATNFSRNRLLCAKTPNPNLTLQAYTQGFTCALYFIWCCIWLKLLYLRKFSSPDSNDKYFSDIYFKFGDSNISRCFVY